MDFSSGPVEFDGSPPNHEMCQPLGFFHVIHVSFDAALNVLAVGILGQCGLDFYCGLSNKGL